MELWVFIAQSPSSRTQTRFPKNLELANRPCNLFSQCARVITAFRIPALTYHNFCAEAETRRYAIAHLRSRAITAAARIWTQRSRAASPCPRGDASGKPQREKLFPLNISPRSHPIKRAHKLDESTVKFPRSWEPEKPFFFISIQGLQRARSIWERFKTFHLEIGYAGCHLWSLQSRYIKRPLCLASGGVRNA